MKLDDLNEQQQQAVTAGAGNHLVLAGAGSGKTRVLVYRIVWLIQRQRVFPDSILAVTFTNKAANEMKSRIASALGRHTPCRWIGTFHSIANRLLRFHHKEAGLNKDFHIMDAADQKSLIKRIMKENNLDDKRWPPKMVQHHINEWKERGLRSHKVGSGGDWMREKIVEIYVLYEKITRREHLVDFAELLLRAYEVLSDNPDLLEHYRKKFRHILIDEFQDTNGMQFAFIQLLKGKNNQVMAVGDEDQSIYGWRGALIENILNFDKLFPDTSIYYLEQNYRSTDSILQAANAVISHNKHRLGKNLWTAAKDNEPLQLYRAIDDKDETLFVIDTIKQHQREGGNLSDCAVFYRVNAQSRILEDKLVAEKIPYRIYGGMRFYDRAEIKHALAYMRLVVNRNDYESFIRVLNIPRRGLGSQTLAKIIRTADRDQLSLWQASQRLVEESALATQTRRHLGNFISLIDSLDEKTEKLPLNEKVAHIIKLSGLEALYKSTIEGQSNLENLAELINASSSYPQGKDKQTMAEFLSAISLEAGGEQAKEHQDAVQLMTVHSAKGLEFPIVFLVGMEECLFPLESLSGETKELEEERRLCYVGITRAREKLYLSCAESRSLYGREAYNPVSRFVEEIPTELVHQINSSYQSKTPSYAPQQPIKMGQRVMHSSFGYGVVRDMEGEGEYARVEVDFETEGHKWLVLQYAELELL